MAKMKITDTLEEIVTRFRGNQYGGMDDDLAQAIMDLCYVVDRVNDKINKYMKKKGSGEIEDE